MSSFSFPFPSARSWHAHSSLWAYSPCTDLRATKVWATKFACRNISIKLLGAQHHPGVYRARGERACGTLRTQLLCRRVQERVNNLSVCAWRQREAEGRERRNTNSAKSPCTALGAAPSWSPDYQRGWMRDQYSICIESGVKCRQFRRHSSRKAFQRKLNCLSNPNTSTRAFHCTDKHLQNPFFPLSKHWWLQKQSGRYQ